MEVPLESKLGMSLDDIAGNKKFRGRGKKTAPSKGKCREA
jgi:hypothetical protein